MKAASDFADIVMNFLIILLCGIAVYDNQVVFHVMADGVQFLQIGFNLHGIFMFHPSDFGLNLMAGIFCNQGKKFIIERNTRHNKKGDR